VFTQVLLRARRDKDVQQTPTVFTLQGAGESGEYEFVATVVTYPWNLGETRIWSIPNAKAYSKYRIVFSDHRDQHVAISKLRFGN
jgi:hypothetical protein